ncbi:MAG: hypothetical protein ACTFAL_00695 [Candidatus Electronema sp. V4]|uniref:hypothetical protein n=1 Tax=Candidatus Electronema sp. V4 TaxID=3454756 RepID=UPI0040556EEB
MDERDSKVAVYPHRLVFLSPPAIRRWRKSRTRRLGRRPKDVFTAEGMEAGRRAALKEGLAPGMEKGIEKGALAQQRKTVLQARQMGMKAAAIAALVGAV